MLIFLGAGASAQFGIPTTPIFTRDIVDLLAEEHPSLVESFQKFHEKRYNESPNFEQILTLLRASTYPFDIPEEHYTHFFLTENPDFKNDYSDIIRRMYDIVYKHCCDPFNPSNDNTLLPATLEKKYSLGYDALFGFWLGRDLRDLNILTTNYDPSIELWCQKRNVECLDGTTNTNNFEVRTCKPITDHINDMSNLHAEKIGLLRLHGSVWRRATNHGRTIKLTQPESYRYFSDLYTDFPTENPNLIYPGQESLILRGERYNYYHFFRNQLEGNVLFIGYSFSHPYLRDPVLDALEDERIKKLGILSPHPSKSVEKLFPKGNIPTKQIVELPGEFGSESGLSSLILWFREFGISSFNSIPGLQTHAYNWRRAVEGKYIREIPASPRYNVL